MKRSEQSRKRTKFLFILIILTAILCITATYAWFTVQRNVSVSGLRVEVGVEDNMLISLDGDNWTRTITIEDMKQLLGTYQPEEGSDTVVYQAVAGEHHNYVPTKLMPVSTVGTVKDGLIQFVTGRTVGGNKLTDIKKCTETDIGTDATSNNNHPYLVFDLYVKNVSPNTETVGELETFQLNKGSKVVALNQSTGLESAVRVGFVAYNTNTGDLLDQGSSLRQNLVSGGEDLVAIWEPNYRMHTDNVKNNDSRISANLSDFTTKGIKEDTTEDIEDVTTDETYTQEVSTNKAPQADNVDQRTQAPETLEAFSLKTVDQGDFKLKSNSITRLRIYMWLEGQDPDCVDAALEGKQLEAVLNFAMPISEH